MVLLLQNVGDVEQIDGVYLASACSAMTGTVPTHAITKEHVAHESQSYHACEEEVLLNDAVHKWSISHSLL